MLLFATFVKNKCKFFNFLVQRKLALLISSVPYKCKTVRNFFRHFCTESLRISAFFLPPKKRRFCFPKTIDSCGSRRLTLVCRTNRGEKLQNSDEGPFFFFEDQHKIGEKDASIGAMTFFFFVFGDHIETGQK